MMPRIDLFEALIAPGAAGTTGRSPPRWAPPQRRAVGTEPGTQGGRAMPGWVRMQRMTTAAPSLEGHILRCLAVLELLRAVRTRRARCADARQVVAGSVCGTG